MKSRILFKGKKKQYITTRDITWDDIRAVFAPKSLQEQYSYLGSVPYNSESRLYKAMLPLVIYMDYKARPKWCPKWVLRFLHLFGNDNSLVRVRNRALHNLFKTLTKGYMIYDYKTKWEWYDLRISIAGDETCWFLSDAIESKFYDAGLREDLAERIKQLDPNTKHTSGNSAEFLREELNKLDEQYANG